MNPFVIRFPVRFRDIDVLGHVNNAVYFTYMESARTEFWRRTFEVADLQGVSFIVARAECDFRVAARYGDEIEVSIRTTEVRNSSFVWEYEIRSATKQTLFALGKTVQVYFDYQTQKSLPVPADVRAKLFAGPVKA